MSAQFTAQSLLHNWQVGPAEHELANYDEAKIYYRQYVINLITPLAKKNLKKKGFVTISTNVLCADINTSAEDIEPIHRDLYLPLEISLTKWNLSAFKDDLSKQSVESRVWLINPGSPPLKCNCFAKDHYSKHMLDAFASSKFTSDYNTVLKEINSFLTSDRVVFSSSLKHVRQDLGSLKWLNQHVNKRIKPIKVFSLEDLYVVLIRHLLQTDNQLYGQGLANLRLMCNDSHNPEYQCDYHKNNQAGASGNCAQSLSYHRSRALIIDVNNFTKLFQE